MRQLLPIRLLLTILAIILIQATQAQQAGSSEADIIIKQLRSAIDDTQRVKLLLRLSTFYLNKTLNPVSDLDSALVLADQALNLAQRLKSAGDREEAIFLKGRIYI